MRVSEVAVGFLRRGMIPVPLCEDSTQISFLSLGLQPYHALSRRRRFKDAAFLSVAFHAALQPPDEERVRSWFDGHRGNVGIVAGHRGLVILDFDDAGAFEAWSRHHGKRLSTPVERTPRGYHVYLACRQPVETSSLYYNGRKAGHIKGFGGYVACSPSSVRDRGAYAWLPGRSPFDCAPATFPDLASISVRPKSWLGLAFERMRGRGHYEPHETSSAEAIGLHPTRGTGGEGAARR